MGQKNSRNSPEFADSRFRRYTAAPPAAEAGTELSGEKFAKKTRLSSIFVHYTTKSVPELAIFVNRQVLRSF